MKIVLSRIDDRFIHGQVLTRWIKVNEADRIIIVSDEVAADEMRKKSARKNNTNRSLTRTPMNRPLF